MTILNAIVPSTKKHPCCGSRPKEAINCYVCFRCPKVGCPDCFLYLRIPTWTQRDRDPDLRLESVNDALHCRTCAAESITIEEGFLDSNAIEQRYPTLRKPA